VIAIFGSMRPRLQPAAKDPKKDKNKSAKKGTISRKLLINEVFDQ